MPVLSRALVAFDERRADPTTNLGTLGAAGNVAYTGTVRLAPTNTAYVRLPGGTASITGDILTVPDAANLRITGDLDIAFHVREDDWTPAVLQALGGKDHLTTGRGYAMTLSTLGRLNLTWSPLGTDASAVTRTSTVAVPFTDGQAGWVRATLDVDNGSGGHSVQFFTAPSSPDLPMSWTQLGTTVTTAGTTSIFATTQPFAVGYARSASANLAADVYRCVVRDGIGGTTVLDVDTSVLTDEGATSFLARTGQTVTINRSTGATYKTEIVVPGTGSRLFNGTSDLGEVANLAGLDFGASDSFTVFALVRRWATATSGAPVIAKQTGTLSAGGWRLVEPATASYRFDIGDTTNTTLSSAPAGAAGQLAFIAGTRDVAADQLRCWLNGVSGPAATDTTAATLATSFPVRVGGFASGGGFNHLRVYAWGVFPATLTSAQLSALRAALTSSDPGDGPRTATLTVPRRNLEISA
jgi:hypothetical protein